MTQTRQDRTPTLVSIRLITDDVARLATFYEGITGTAARWATPDFAEVATPAGTLAIGSTRTVALFGPGAARAADNRTAIIEFRVEDVDAEFRRLQDLVTAAGGTFVTTPTTMPWGNRSLLFRDPDGNLVNYFAPVTPEAVARLAR